MDIKAAQRSFAGRKLERKLSETSRSRLNSERPIGCHDYRSFRVAVERPTEKIRATPQHGVRNGSVVPRRTRVSVVTVPDRVHGM